jgi:LPXTG-motif cell wall-anchored protein
MPTPTITTNANGSITVTVTVPPSTPSGVYLIAIVGTDARGVSRVIIVPVVVRTRARAASASPASGGASAGGAAVAEVAVPPEVRAIVANTSPAEASAISDAFLNDGASMGVVGSLIVALPATGSDSTRPLVAAAAVSLVGGSLLVLRSKRTSRKVIAR